MQFFYLGRLEETRSKLNEAKVYYIDHAMKIFQVEGKRRLSRFNDDANAMARSEVSAESVNIVVSQSGLVSPGIGSIRYDIF